MPVSPGRGVPPFRPAAARVGLLPRSRQYCRPRLSVTADRAASAELPPAGLAERLPVSASVSYSSPATPPALPLWAQAALHPSAAGRYSTTTQQPTMPAAAL